MPTAVIRLVTEVSQEEYALLQAAARRAGTSMARLVRDFIATLREVKP